MRGVLFGGAAAALIVAAGCAPSTETAPPASAIQSASTSDEIVIGERSNICVSVSVDQRIWPRPKTAETDAALSGILASELNVLLGRRGVSSHITNPHDRPGPRPEPRFVGSFNFVDPLCADAEDVRVTAAYEPRHDGSPFLFRYRIEQGQTFQIGTVDFDVAEEIRMNRIRGYSQRRTNSIIISEDIRSRANVIASYVTTGQ